MSHLIRDATLNDAAEIFLLIAASRVAAYGQAIHQSHLGRFLRAHQSNDQNVTRFRAKLAEKLQYPNVNILKVIVLDDRICGYSAACLKEDGAHLTNLHILPSAQGKGYGTLLLESMLKSLEGTTVQLSVVKGNEAAIRLYIVHQFRFIRANKKDYYGLQVRSMKRY